MQITLRPDFDVQHTVARHLVEHVLEKRQPCVKSGIPRSIKVYRDTDLRFQCIAANVRLSL